MKSRLNTYAAILCAGAMAISFAPTAMADDVDDEIIRAETQIQTISADNATMHAAENYNMAKLRLQEARAAEDSGDENTAMQRLKESRLHAEIVQAQIELAALERTKTELETALKALTREVQS